MEQIEAFYKKLFSYEINDIWGFKFLQHMMEIFFILPMSLTVADDFLTDDWRFVFFAMIFMGFAIYGRLAPFVYAKKGNMNQVLSQKLRYVPIPKHYFFKKKWQILSRYIVKLGGFSLVMNLVISVAFLGGISTNNLLPIGMGIYGLLIGLWMIKI
ncbi:MAG: hypothetical protein J6F30_15550 [Cellulosilyticum sp.]|nr:hypothetical protein [Cellulosilyticum sp.]